MAEEIFNIYTMVRETGETIHAYETQWCKIRTVVPGREWYYCFEDMKGQPNPDYDYNDPLLHVQRLNGRLQITVVGYSGVFHSDVFAFDRVLWRGVGGVEGRHVGESLIVELPEPPPPIPPPPPPPPAPAPPELEPLAERLDAILAVLRDVKREMEMLAVKSNTYSSVTIDLSIARDEFEMRPIAGQAMTVFSCTGTMELKLGNIALDSIIIEPLTYPEMIVIDRFDFDRFYIRNAAQPGAEAVLIAWRRE